jgi:MFS family permease
VTLVFVGFSVVTMLTTANGYVQTTTDPALRGRVLALYMAILLGGTPVGAPVVGWIASEWGPRAAILVAAIAALIACGIGVTWTLLSGRVHRHESRRFALTLDETRPIEVVPEPVPEEFSDEVAGTTAIPLPRSGESAPHR